MTQNLITRLSKLDAPDREVDALIVKHFGLENECPYWLHRFTRSTPMRLTASVDAAIALAERVLPFTHLVSTYHDDMACSVKIHCCPEGLSGEWKFDVKGDHEHLAVAYCIAILRAIALLRAKEASNA